MTHSTISPKVDMRYWELEKLAEQESVLVPVEPEGNWDSARVRIHQLCKRLGFRVATREAPEGWQVYRVDGSGQGTRRALERTLRAPYDQMDRLREEACVLLECGRKGQPPVRETVTSRAYQIARKRGWRIAVRQVPRGVRVYRTDHEAAAAPPEIGQTDVIEPEHLRHVDVLRLFLVEPDDMAHAVKEVRQWCEANDVRVRFFDMGSGVVDVMPLRGGAK